MSHFPLCTSGRITLTAALRGSVIRPMEWKRKLRPIEVKEVVKVTGLAEGR